MEFIGNPFVTVEKNADFSQAGLFLVKAIFLFILFAGCIDFPPAPYNAAPGMALWRRDFSGIPVSVQRCQFMRFT